MYIYIYIYIYIYHVILIYIISCYIILYKQISNQMRQVCLNFVFLKLQKKKMPKTTYLKK